MIYYYVLHVGVFPLHVCFCIMCAQCLQEPEEGDGPGVTDACEHAEPSDVMNANYGANFSPPTHEVGQHWFIWVPQACRRDWVASRQWLGDSQCYLSCVRLSDQNSKNKIRRAKAVWVPGRKWAIHPGSQGQQSLSQTEQEVWGSWKLVLQKKTAFWWLSLEVIL